MAKIWSSRWWAAASALVGMVLLNIACSSGTGGRDGTAPRLARGDTVPRTPPRIHESRPGQPVYGSFEQDVLVRLSMLQTRIFRFVQSHGQLPGSIEAITPDTTDPVWSLRRDPWNRRVVFRSNGNAYEVRSAGADGAIRSTDDLAIQGVRGREKPCRMRGPEGSLSDFRNEPPSCASLGADSASFPL